MGNILESNLDTKTENFEPILLKIDSKSCLSFLSIPHFLHCNTRALYFEKKCWNVLKLLGWSTMSSFSRIWPLISYYLSNKDSILSNTSFRVTSPSRWNNNSLEMWKHMKSKASSSLFINLDFSTYYWGSTSIPIFILYRPLLHKAICISALQSM